jgi:chemotaxis signal transduction protein
VKTNSISMPIGRQPARRLAGRADGGQSHLVFEVGSDLYACPIGDVERLLRWADANIQPAAHAAPSWEAGSLVDESNGVQIPVISLRALWGLPSEGARSDREALLVVRVSGKSVALLVDACLSVLPGLPADSARFDLPAPILGSRGKVFESAVAWHDSLLVILRINNLLLQAGPAASPRRLESPIPS